MTDSTWRTPVLEEISIPGSTYGNADDSGGDASGNQDEGTLS